MTPTSFTSDPTPAGILPDRRLIACRCALAATGFALVAAAVLGSRGVGLPAQTPVASAAQTSNGAAAGLLDRPSADAVEEALQVYNSGRYGEAEAQASRLLRASGGEQSEERARARWVQAFAAARRGDLELAGRRFSLLQKEAAGERWTLERPAGFSPAKTAGSSSESTGVEPAPPPVDRSGQPLATLEEDAAYQHAVLTAALAVGQGHGKASPGRTRPSTEQAEALFIGFMEAHPESPLVHAAIRRIGMLHGGEIPARAQKVWQESMATAANRAEARGAAASDCGPEVLAEALRRLGLAGDGAGVAVLMSEMGTTSRGSSLAAVKKAAEARGCRARGLLRDELGLRKLMAEQTAGQVVIALVQPSHFVIVERARGAEVRYWDPAAAQARGRDDLPGGPPGPRAAPDFLWRKNWRGHVLVLEREDAPAGAGEGGVR